jgi:hypothetical protein
MPCDLSTGGRKIHVRWPQRDQRLSGHEPRGASGCGAAGSQRRHAGVYPVEMIVTAAGKLPKANGHLEGRRRRHQRLWRLLRQNRNAMIAR